jgi:hypothetical protein
MRPGLVPASQTYRETEYQPVKEIRHALTTNANVVLAPAFQMPEG